MKSVSLERYKSTSIGIEHSQDKSNENLDFNVRKDESFGSSDSLHMVQSIYRASDDGDA